MRASSQDKNYLDWEIEVRINSILMMMELLSDQLNEDDKSLRSSTTKSRTEVSLRQSMVFKEIHNREPFYEEFLKKTMLYHKFNEDRHDELYKQTNELLRMNH